VELRIKRIRPGDFSIHAESGEEISNVEHKETRYLGEEVITTITIRTLAKNTGKFVRTKKMQEAKSGD
jgi:hypothetical protein